MATVANQAMTADRSSPHRRITPRQAWFMVLVLFLANMVGYLDRNIIVLLVQPIKVSLGLSDGQIGLVQGAAFILTFSIAGIFIGRLVDAGNRRNLVVICVFIWSLCASAGGLAEAGWQLFVTRMGVGIGEAALLPAAISMIVDAFPPQHRGRATGLFMTGIYAGVGLSLILVGAALPSVADFSSYLQGQGVAIEPWRIIMLGMLPPGLLCCLALLLVREPGRTVVGEQATGWSGLRDWISRPKVFLPHHLAFGFIAFGSYGTAAWLPTILIREHGFAAREAGLYYGATVTLVSMASVFAGGVIGDRLSMTRGIRGRAELSILCMPFAIAGFIAFLLSSSTITLFASIALFSGAMSIAAFNGLVTVADLSPERSRGQIASIFLAFTGLLGMGGGPATIGYLSDALGPSGWSLEMVWAVTCGLGCLLASPLILLPYRTHGELS